MIEIAAIVLSLLWMLIAAAILAGKLGFEEGGLLPPILINLLFLGLGIFAVLRALRRRRDLLFALLIVLVPLLHVAAVLLELYNVAALFAPTTLLIVFAIMQRIRQRKSLALMLIMAATMAVRAIPRGNPDLLPFPLDGLTPKQQAAPK